MDGNENQFGELDALLSALTAEGLGTQQQQRLSQIVQQSAEARDYYLEYVELHALLTWHFDGTSGDIFVALEDACGVAGEKQGLDAEDSEDVDPSVIAELLSDDEFASHPVEHASQGESDFAKLVRRKAESKTRSGKWDAVLPSGRDGYQGADMHWPSLLWVAAAAALVMVGYYFARSPTGQEVAEVVPPAVGSSKHRPMVATLTRVMGAEWASPSTSLRPDIPVSAGAYELVRGQIRITTLDGAQMGIVGPAKFSIIDSLQMELSLGKLVVYCPPKAKGFRVATQGADVIDLGTEFGIQVDQNGGTEVHVLAGKVAVRPVQGAERPGGRFELVAGQASHIDATGTRVRNVDFSVDRFSSLRPLFHRNLVINGGFEADAPGEVTRSPQGRATFHVINITGWENAIGATTLLYHQGPDGGSFAVPGQHPVPSNHGRCFLIGLSEGVVSQGIDVSAAAELIDADRVGFELAGWLGGWKNQIDNMTVVGVALDSDGNALDEVQLGPLTVQDRDSKTGFWHFAKRGDVPEGTRSVRVDLVSEFEYDQAPPDSVHKADAYADNVSLKLILK